MPTPNCRGSRRVVSMAGSDEVVTAYANALASLAASEKKLETIHSDIDRLGNIIRDADDLPDFLSSPLVDENKRRQVLETVCREAGFDGDTVNFLNLVMDKGRADLLHEICQTFEEQYCKMTDTCVATLTSAIQLDEEEQYQIAKKLRELSGAKNIKLKPVLDPSLIAGFVVEFGSSQIDMSVKGQLNRVSSELKAKAASS